MFQEFKHMYCALCGIQMSAFDKGYIIRLKVDVGYVSPSLHGGVVCVKCTKKWGIK